MMTTVSNEPSWPSIAFSAFGAVRCSRPQHELPTRRRHDSASSVKFEPPSACCELVYQRMPASVESPISSTRRSVSAARARSPAAQSSVTARGSPRNQPVTSTSTCDPLLEYNGGAGRRRCTDAELRHRLIAMVAVGRRRQRSGGACRVHRQEAALPGVGHRPVGRECRDRAAGQRRQIHLDLTRRVDRRAARGCRQHGPASIGTNRPFGDSADDGPGEPAGRRRRSGARRSG